MSYKIIDECIYCGTCADECPNDAVFEGEEQYHIDPEKCTECVGFYESPRCTEACPIELPQPDSDHQETKEGLLEKWRKLHPGETPKVS